MATLVFGMNLSLDGYIDHERFGPDRALFRHWTEQVAGLTGSLYGRRLYEIMRYWDDDDPAWGPEERAFAAVWRAMPKWVVSRSEVPVGPNATQIAGDVAAQVRALKDGHEGEIAVGGADLAGWLTDRGLIDLYRLYFHPVVLGGGTPFFTGARAPLRLVASDRIGNAMRLSYVPA